MSTDLLRINAGLALAPQTADPANASNGDWYYNSTLGVFRSYQNGAWGNMLSSAATTSGPLATVELDLITQPYTELQINDQSAKVFNYYDETDGPLPYNVWTQSGNMNTARPFLGGAGSQNSVVSFGGGQAGSQVATSELFNGSAWTSTGGLNTARTYTSGCGVQGAALSIGGYNGGPATGATEKFNGATWTATGSLVTGRYELGGVGTQNAALSFFGNSGSTVLADTETFNGSTWTNISSPGGTAETATVYAGTQSAALSAGGSNSGYVAITQLWNTSSWSTISATLLAAQDYSSSCGTQNSVLSFGGRNSSNAPQNIAQKFNGIAWYGTTYLPAATWGMGAGGSANLAVGFGGDGGSGTTAANETYKFFGNLQPQAKITFKGKNSFIDSSQQSSVVTAADSGVLIVEMSFAPDAGAANNQEYNDIVALGLLNYGDGLWAATGSLSTARGGAANAGTFYAGLFAGGNNAGTVYGITELFNGSMWSGAAALPIAVYGNNGLGLQNSTISARGVDTSNNFYANANYFNGVSWSAISSCNLNYSYPGACGTFGSGLLAGGSNTGSTVQTTCEIFNGSAWSITASLNTARFRNKSVGSPSSALTALGQQASTPAQVSERFNQQVWFNSGTVINMSATNSGDEPACFGSVAKAIYSGAYEQVTGNAYIGAGGFFILIADRPNGGRGAAGGGSASAGWAAGGNNTGDTSQTLCYTYTTQAPLPYTGFEFGKLTYVQSNLNTLSVAGGTTYAINYLVVGGGGGGGGDRGGGGSGGGVLPGSMNISSGTYPVVVGLGGNGGVNLSSLIGLQGQSSSFNGIVALGGGGGGDGDSGLVNGGNGASGGGGGAIIAGGGTAGLGISGQGYPGGIGVTNGSSSWCGGGGGAGGPGGNATTNNGGNGGIGIQSSISGTATYYGGGSGGSAQTGTVGTGGLGGGGPGVLDAGAGAVAGINAPANTGGGGASAGGGANKPGGNGGSGIVIISYAGSQVATGGTVTSSGGNTIHTFTSNGTLVFP